MHCASFSSSLFLALPFRSWSTARIFREFAIHLAAGISNGGNGGGIYVKSGSVLGWDGGRWQCEGGDEIFAFGCEFLEALER